MAFWFESLIGRADFSVYPTHTLAIMAARKHVCHKRSTLRKNDSMLVQRDAAGSVDLVVIKSEEYGLSRLF